jgi:dihydroorotate dehydrogenase (NAD+) catalytic subunit
MINSVGLQNVGVAEFIKQKLPKLRRFRTPVIANVFGYSVDDYCEVVRNLEDADGITAYELNVSCPNTKCGGIQFSSDPAMLASVVAPVRRLAKRPVIVKLSPNVAAIEPLAQAAEEAGADAISLVNTFVALSVDARLRRPRIGNGMGGLSGPAIKPIALRMVWQAARSIRIPVIGLGGIGTGEDAAEFMVAGATAVQVGTASFWDPRATARIVQQLERFCRRDGIAAVRDLTGTLKM